MAVHLKKIYLFHMLLFFAFISNAQLSNLGFRLSPTEKKAAILFDNGSYNDASKLYQQLNKKAPSDITYRIRLAECYRLMNDTKNAEEWYANLMTDSIEVPCSVKLNYAEVLIKNGKSDSALNVLQSYYNVSGIDSIGLSRVERLKRYAEYYQDSLAYSIVKLNVNSELSDFFPVYYKEGFVFLSQRSEGEHLIKVTDAKSNSNFYSLYYTSRVGETEYQTPTPFSLFKNSLHDGPLTFFDNESKVIFSKNVKGNGSGNKNLNLFYSEISKDGKSWSQPQLLPFNKKEFSFSHPYYNEKDSTLYFVSNMSGGYGGTDIYFIKYVNGVWGNIVNAGKEINTSGDEMFPYVDRSNVLYFSSNGHPGMGGFDIFSIDRTQDIVVMNPGFPINSSFDDFSFVVSKEGHNGLFCSNREKRGIDDDIYSVKFNSVRLDGFVVDKLKLGPLELAEVKVYDKESGNLLRTTKTNSKGRYYFPVIPGRKYEIYISKNNYKTERTEVICSTKEESNISNTVILEKLNKSFVSGKVVDDSIPIVYTKVVFADLSSDSIETTFTDSLGRFQCEINIDTTSLFYIEHANFKSIYALKPVKRKRKGSGMSFITIPVEEIETKEIELIYVDSLSIPIKKATIVVRNEFNKESKEYVTDTNGKVVINAWNLGKYSVYRKENQKLVYIMSFVPDDRTSVQVKMDIE